MRILCKSLKKFQLEDIIQRMRNLPASHIAHTINQTLHESETAVITAPLGASKSTLLPLTILASMEEAAQGKDSIEMQPTSNIYCTTDSFKKQVSQVSPVTKPYDIKVHGHTTTIRK